MSEENYFKTGDDPPDDFKKKVIEYLNNQERTKGTGGVVGPSGESYLCAKKIEGRWVVAPYSNPNVNAEFTCPSCGVIIKVGVEEERKTEDGQIKYKRVFSIFGGFEWNRLPRLRRMCQCPKAIWNRIRLQ